MVSQAAWASNQVRSLTNPVYSIEQVSDFVFYVVYMDGNYAFYNVTATGRVDRAEMKLVYKKDEKEDITVGE